MHNYFLLPVLAGLLFACPVRADEESIQELVEGNRAFAFDLYRRVVSEDENLFFAPHSISAALAMTYAGAREETEVQMSEVLHFPFSASVLNPIFGELEKVLLEKQGEGVELLSANSLWPQKRYELEPDYLNVVSRYYRSEIFPTDYADPEAARLAINAWVEKQTRDRIQNLIAPGVLNELTRLVLVNAVYFKGLWATPFPEANTRDRTFNPIDDEPVEISTMRGRISARYAEVDEGKVLELDYQGGDFALMVMLPAPRRRLDVLERNLSPRMLTRWEEGLETREVDVYLPRFTMEASFNLGQTLKAMGMDDAFDPDNANFSGIDGLVNSLFISEVVHKAFVEMTEEGTEAAAATAVIMMTKTAMPREVPEFRADRPFVFLIKERSTGSILFLGRMVKPVL